MLLMLALLPGASCGHPVDPGYLELDAFGDSGWRVTWRKPEVQGSPMEIDAVLPEGCEPRRGPAPAFDGLVFETAWIAFCRRGLGGGTILIDGLDRTRTDVLVRYTLERGGAPQLRRLTSADPAFVVPAPQRAGAVFFSYLRFGTDHILQGLDHLLFIFALLLLLRKPRKLVIAVTAFTIAHSLSLAMATLGWIVVPSKPVEAIVALSIVVLATELAQATAQRKRMTERFPWVVSFGFGLLHGLAFAGALINAGLPQGDVALALLAFNLGVEAGQIMFIGGALAAGYSLSRLGWSRVLKHESSLVRITAYGIGGLAAFWMFERIAQFWA